MVRVLIRRFKCVSAQCPARTFAEQIPGLTSPFARCTPLLADWWDRIGLALAGRAGARLAEGLGAAVSRDTLLRRVRALPDPVLDGAPAVLGVDEFALKKGHVYGTVLVDMASRRPVDLPADREVATFAGWLRAHPGAEAICRDRAGSFAEGARAGAPEAIHIADRWHLWHNLAEAVERTVSAHRGCLRDPAPTPTASITPPDPADSAAVRRPDRAAHRFRDRVHERHAAVHALLAQGHGIRAIARELGLGRHTVQRYARAAAPTDMLRGQWGSRASKLDAFKPYLHQRLCEGVTSATTLHAEITQLGYRGSYGTVSVYLRPHRRAPSPPPAPAPSVRRTVGWLTRHPAGLGEDEKSQLNAILARCHELDALSDLVREFAEMMVERRGHQLDGWIAAAQASGLPPLVAFARGLTGDLNAVRHGLTLPHSSGAVEGNVNRIKFLKRQMYGRAGFALLRKRVLLA